jgi:predicted outer membrane protein
MQSAATPGRAVGTLLVVFGLIATLGSLLIPIYFFDGNRSVAVSRSGWRDDGMGTWKTRYGPLTTLDREFMRSIRTAGLWELPACRMARERSTQRSMQTMRDRIVAGDAELDRRVIKAAVTLKVPLPNRPPRSQRRYLAEIEQARGKKFDELLVNHMRKQDGTTMGLLSLVRDQTRNSMVRSLATRANTIVLDHIETQEDTGLVDYGEMSQGN